MTLPIWRTIKDAVKRTCINIFHWKAFLCFTLPTLALYGIILFITYILGGMTFDFMGVMTWWKILPIVIASVVLVCAILYAVCRIYFVWMQSVMNDALPNLFKADVAFLWLYVRALFRLFGLWLLVVLPFSVTLFWGIAFNSVGYEAKIIEFLSIVFGLFIVILLPYLMVASTIPAAAVNGYRLSSRDAWGLFKGFKKRFFAILLVVTAVQFVFSAEMIAFIIPSDVEKGIIFNLIYLFVILKVVSFWLSIIAKVAVVKAYKTVESQRMDYLEGKHVSAKALANGMGENVDASTEIVPKTEVKE